MQEKLYDPVTQEELTIFTSKGESNEVNRVGFADRTGNLINNLANYHKVNNEEMRRRLANSDCDAPITYHDEVYWCEVE